ncbi:hypothetical protein [Pendulispora albinea]|uniref:Uncharacterized protein n=1 Tax=Pendulispora albinea TaxID=2741071 RepID=A0ABZ2LP28_9BACT
MRDDANNGGRDAGAIRGADGAVGSVPDGGEPKDAGPDVTTPVCGSGNANACDGIPSGWEPVGYLPGSANCGTGYDAGPTMVTDPTGGSCGCDCRGKSPQENQCPGNIRMSRWDGDPYTAACTSDFTGNDEFSQGCSDLQPRTIHHFRAIPQPANPVFGCSNGSCSGSKDTSTLTTATVRICTSAVSECRLALCAQPHACIVRDGDRSCPSGYTEKHLLGTGADITCGNCTGCSYSATCSTSVKLYTGNNCTGTNDSVDVDGGCNPVIGQDASSPKTYQALYYENKFQTGGYDASAAAPVRSVTGALRTVCCKP